MYGSAISVRRGLIGIFSSSITSNTNGSDAIFITDSYITLQNSTVSDNGGIGLRTRNAIVLDVLKDDIIGGFELLDELE